MSNYVRKRPDGRYDVYHMHSGEFVGTFTNEWEATRAYCKGTSVERMYEEMLAEDLFTDEDGRPVTTWHLARVL